MGQHHGTWTPTWGASHGARMTPPLPKLGGPLGGGDVHLVRSLAHGGAWWLVLGVLATGSTGAVVCRIQFSRGGDNSTGAPGHPSASATATTTTTGHNTTPATPTPTPLADWRGAAGRAMARHPVRRVDHARPRSTVHTSTQASSTINLPKHHVTRANDGDGIGQKGTPTQQVHGRQVREARSPDLAAVRARTPVRHQVHPKLPLGRLDGHVRLSVCVCVCVCV